MIKTIEMYDSNFENWGGKIRERLTISNWMLVFEELDLIKKLKIIFVSRSPICCKIFKKKCIALRRWCSPMGSIY